MVEQFWGKRAARSARNIFSSSWVKLGICALVAIPVLSALIGQIEEMDGAQIAEAMRSISGQSIVIAMGFTIISFIAMARYDDVALRVLGINIPSKSSIYGGFVATSLSQALGLGLLVGSVARWRCYREHGVSLAQGGIITSVVIGGFMFGFFVILGVTNLIDPSGLANLLGRPESQILLGAWAVIGVSLGVLTLSVAGVTLRMGPIVLKAPRWRILRANIVLAALDTIPAAIALWVLIPAESAPTLLVVIPVYLTALGLGLISNAPGGIGVLELTCLMALPVTPPEHLLAALIVFRGIFYGIPVVLGLVMLIAKEFPSRKFQKEKPQASRVLARARVGQVPDAVADILRGSLRAESGLARSGDKEFLLSNCGRACLMFAQSGNSLVAVSDPMGAPDAWAELLVAFKAEAAARFVAPVFYKASPVFAALLCREGMQTCRISTEAEVPLADYSLDGPKRRELRRKIRKAEGAGITLTVCRRGQFNETLFAELGSDWLGDQSEKGFSMGRFDAKYLANYVVIEAWIGNMPVGFVSLWESGAGNEFSIDVIRFAADAPDGTTHALCHAAALCAKSKGADVLSLCAVLFAGIETPGNAPESALAWVFKNKPNWHSSKGLYRFKNTFRPNWAPRYLAAPNWTDATLGALDVARLISAPAPIEAQQPDKVWRADSDEQLITTMA